MKSRAARSKRWKTNAAARLAEQLAQAQIRASALEEGVELAEKTILVQRDRIAELESALTKAEEQAPPPPSVSVSAEEEIAVLEAKLEERGRRVAELEAEVSRREKLVKELVARIEGAPATVDDDLQKKLDELALLAARQQSELEARAWKIEELSRTAQS
jgi:chromosome segregation ATPase